MAVAEISLSTFGFDELEENSLQALLTLSGRALSTPWRYVRDFKTADVVLVSLNSGKGEDFWKNHAHHYPSLLLVACSSQTDLATTWKLKLLPGLLPSRKELVELLNALSLHIAKNPSNATHALAEITANEVTEILGTSPTDRIINATQDTSGNTPLKPDITLPTQGIAHAAPANPHHSKPSATHPIFDPSRHFLGLLQTIIAAAEDSIFVLPGRVWLVASPQQQRYYSTVSIDQLQPLLQVSPGDVQLRHLQVEKVLESAWAREMIAHPLAELLWFAALASSDGRLLAGWQAEDIVRLKQWPQVAHLPSYRKFLRVAAFMRQNAASLQSIAEHTGTPIAAVFDFHNACVAMGLVERLAEADWVNKPSAGPAKELYRRISSRLARTRQEGNEP